MRNDELLTWLTIEASYDRTGFYQKPLQQAADRIQELENNLIEATAELIYLRKHGKDGTLWRANESKDVWRDMARKELSQN